MLELLTTEREAAGLRFDRGHRKSEDATLILLAAIAVVLIRSPLLLWQGRVFAEEGSVYLQGALQAGSLRSLLTPHQGYYSVLMNGFATASKLFPLELAGYLSVAGAVGILLLTVYLAVQCEAFDMVQARWLAAAAILLSPGVEVWLTLLDAQFYLAVCVALILISSEDRMVSLRTGTLLLAGLTGPVSCALTPFFLWKAWQRRTGTRLVQAGILVLCSAVQGVLLLANIRAGTRTFDSAGKLQWFGPVVFLKVFAVSLGTRLGGFLTQRVMLRFTTLWVFLLLWLLFAGCSGLVWLVCRSHPKACTLLLLAGASLCFNYLGDPAPLSMIFRGEFRYFFTGTTLIWLALVLACSSSRALVEGRRLRWIVLGVVLLSGVADAAGYWTRLQKTEPRWSEQVAAWRRDPERELRVPPADWTGGIRIPRQ